MADYLATALVRVRPDTKNFTTELRADLKKRISTIKLTVPVRADLKAFHQQVNRELKANPIKIPVVPDMTGFQAELRRRVESSAKGVKARVQVEAVGGGVARRGAGVGAVDPLGNIGTIGQTEAAIRKRTQAEEQAVIAAREAAAVQRAAFDAERQRAANQRVLDQTTKKLATTNRALAATLKTSTSEQRIAEALSRQETLAKKQLAAAIALSDVARKNEARSILQSNAAQRASIAQTVATNKATKEGAALAEKRAAQERFLARGAGATGLSLLGVRGATLAANSAFLAGAAAVAVFAKSIQSAAALEQTLNVFATTTGATADQMARASEQAKALGRDITLPAVSASDAAAAFTELGKAGLDVENSLAGARGVLQLATAASLDNAQATELVASALNAFGLAGAEATRVADLLTGAANEAQGSIADIGIALQQSSAAARQVGVSLQDTVALLTLLARNGLKGSDAGTSLRTAFLRLIRPTKAASDLLEKLHVNIRDISGDVRPEVFADLSRALQGVSRAQRDAALATIFGQDAFRAAAILGREGASGLDEVRVATQKQGLAADLAAAKTKGFSGQVEGLKNNLDTLGIAFGQAVIGPLGSLIESLVEVVDLANKASEALDNLEQSVPGGGLFDRFIGDAPITLGDFIKETKSAFALAQRGRFGGGIGDPFQSAREGVKDFNKELLGTFNTSQELSGILAKTRGPNEAVQKTQELSDALIGSSESAVRAREQLLGVGRLIQALGRAPTALELQFFFDHGFVDTTIQKERDRAQQFLNSNPLRVGFFVPPIPPDPLNQTAETGAKVIADSLLANLPPALADAFNKAFDVADVVARDRADQTAKIIAVSASRIEFKFQEPLLNAQIAGNTQGELAIQKQKEKAIQDQLDLGVEDRQKRIKLKQALQQIQNDIESIENGIANDAKASAARVKDARDKADQAVLNSIALEEHRRQNAVARAALTKRLNDDIEANKALRNFYARALAEVRKTVRDATTKANEIVQLQGQLTAAEDAIAKAQKEQRDARKQRRQDALDKAEESRQLDIQIAQATGNKAKEIRARKAEINALEVRIRATRAGSLQRKRLILQLRQEQKELRELQKEKAKSGDEFKKLAFQFLTTQQGFAANLFSNVLGPAQAANTVGRPSPPAAPVAATGVAAGAAAGAAAGQRVPTPSAVLDRATERADAHGGGGITRGQAATLVHLMRRQIKILTDIHKDQGHPESRTRRIQQRTSTETGKD